MSKKVSSPKPESSAWIMYAVIGFCGILTGSTVTYLALRPNLATAPAAVGQAAAPVSNPDPTSHLPTPDLTAGQSPAQADRTLGNFYYDHENWAQAIKHYESAIRQGSDDSDIRTDLGNAYRFTGRPDDALAQYGLAQKMNPNHEHSLFNQGGVYFENLKQPAKAVAVWQEYLVRFPNGTNTLAARRMIAQAQGGPVALPEAADSGPAAPSAPSSEDLILRQIQSAKGTGKP